MPVPILVSNSLTTIIRQILLLFSLYKWEEMLNNLPKIMVNMQQSWDLNLDDLAPKAQLISHFPMLYFTEFWGLKLWKVIIARQETRLLWKSWIIILGSEELILRPSPSAPFFKLLFEISSEKQNLFLFFFFKLDYNWLSDLGFNTGKICNFI